MEINLSLHDINAHLWHIYFIFISAFTYHMVIIILFHTQAKEIETLWSVITIQISILNSNDNDEFKSTM